MNIVTQSPEVTRELGRRIGELARPGDVYLLTGNLGAGKTCLTQGIAWGLGIDDYAMSPTFIIVRELYGRLPLYHIDLYRLDRIEESIDLGLDEYFLGGGVSVEEKNARGIPRVLPPVIFIPVVVRRPSSHSRCAAAPNRARADPAAVHRDHASQSCSVR